MVNQDETGEEIRPTVLQCQAPLSKKVVLSFLNPFPEVKVVPPTI